LQAIMDSIFSAWLPFRIFSRNYLTALCETTGITFLTALFKGKCLPAFRAEI